VAFSYLVIIKSMTPRYPRVLSSSLNNKPTVSEGVPTRTFDFFVYYESIKRELQIRGIYECRCDERLQTKTKEFKHLAYTGLVLELEHLKIETRLIDEKFANTMGEYVTERS
jgi:hypothetical protein